jgi:hypothetical protein
MRFDGGKVSKEGRKMNEVVRTQIEESFLALPREERGAIISHGIALRLSDLRKRLFLAESKVRHFEEKYNISLTRLDAEGLPDDADYEMHEDYILWHHWAAVANKIQEDINALEKIAQQGLYMGESARVGH